MARILWRAAWMAVGLVTTLACRAQQAPAVPLPPRPAPPAELPAPSRALDLKAPARPALPVREGVAVRVERFAVSGNTRIGSDEIAAALQPFVQRTLRFDELAAAADAVTDLYRRRGFLLALAYLPEQQIRDGEVEIVVLEGRLGSLSLAAAPPGLDRAFTSAMAQWNIGNGDVLGEDNLVRNLLVLNEWAGIAVGADVRPGRQVGTADVTVDLRETGPRLAGSVALDNHGSRATGRVRLGGSVAARELAGRGDLLNLQAMLGDDSGLRSLQAGYSFAMHPSGTRLSASLSQLDYRVVDPAFAALDAKGSATYLQFTLDQPVWRRVGHALTLRGGLVSKRLRDRVEAFAQHDDRHVEALLLALRGEHGGAAGTPQTSYTVSATAGRVGFDDPVAAAADAVLRRTAGRFARINIDLAREQPLSDRLALLARVAAQAAMHRNLDSAERSVLGGPNSLRPYGDLSTQADQSVQASLEARYRLSLGTVAASASAFIDLGQGRVDQRPAAGSDNGVQSRLIGIGAEAALPYELTLRVAATRQNVDPPPPGSPAWVTRGWVEVVKAF